MVRSLSRRVLYDGECSSKVTRVGAVVVALEVVAVMLAWIVRLADEEEGAVEAKTVLRGANAAAKLTVRKSMQLLLLAKEKKQ